MAAEQRQCRLAYESCPWLAPYLGVIDQNWKPVSLTHVVYPEDDLVGKILAWSSLVPIFIIVSFLTLIIFRRELHTMAWFLGILLNEVVNMVLKRMLKQPRPCSALDQKKLYNKYGMPSSHAQFMGFFAIYAIFFAYCRLRVHVYEKFMDNIRQHFIAFSSAGVALIVCYSRVYLHYHTVEQVLIGLCTGLFIGTFWFYIVDTVFTPYFQSIANTKIAEYFFIRDSTNIPDILWFEYTASRTEARQRLRRTTQKSQ
eukprot:TCONS_00006298-protein